MPPSLLSFDDALRQMGRYFFCKTFVGYKTHNYTEISEMRAEMTTLKEQTRSLGTSNAEAAKKVEQLEAEVEEAQPSFEPIRIAR